MTFVNALKKKLSIAPTPDTNDAPLTFTKSRKAMVKELALAKENGTLMGIYSKSFGEGMFLVGISDIEYDHGTEVIVFETYDQSGTILSRTRLSIDEIKMVCPLNRKYVNPILNRLLVV